MKPERQYPDLSRETEIKANEIAPVIETIIINFGKSQYGNSFRLERFTEIAWNGYPFKGELSFHIGLWESPPDTAVAPKGYRFHLAVDFMKDTPSEETMKALCNALYRQTGLPTRLYYGSGYNRLRYLIPEGN